MKFHVFWVVVLLFVILGNAVSAAPESQSANKKNNHKKIATEHQLQFVKKLLEVSSAAQKVRASENMNVQALYSASNDLYQKALAAYDDGDKEAAGEALFYATETMFRATRLVKNEGVQHSKEQREFDQRLKSINALLEALERVSNEKGAADKLDVIKSMAESEIANAQALMKTGQPFSARKALDSVYVEVKTAISSLRSGDTLVRSLHFETKKDEYLYELDRNDTHKMLVKLLLEEKMKKESVMKRVQKFLDKAAELRKQAEEMAKEGDYEAAVEACEQSTKQLVRAIRSSGFFIPG